MGSRTHNIAVEIPPPSPPRKAHNLEVRALPKVPKSPSCSKRRPKAKKPPHRVVISSNKEELNMANLRSESNSTSKEATLDSYNNDHMQFRVVKHDRVQPSLCAKNKINHNPSKRTLFGL